MTKQQGGDDNALWGNNKTPGGNHKAPGVNDKAPGGNNNVPVKNVYAQFGNTKTLWEVTFTHQDNSKTNGVNTLIPWNAVLKNLN